jgi:hypothetical protein
MMEHLAERRFARGGVAPIASVDTTALTHGADDQDRFVLQHSLVEPCG